MKTELKDLLSKFDVNYADQVKKYKVEGKKIAGTMAAYCPNELIHAAGYLPMNVWGEEMELRLSKEYFPAFYSTVAQSTLEKGLLGDYNDMAFMVIPGLTDTMKATGQNWKKAVTQVPFINIAIAQNRKIEAGMDFNEIQMRKVKKRIEDICGKEIKDEDIEAAIKLFNENRKKIQEFVEIANKHLDIITARIRSNVITSAYLMDKNEHNDLLDQLISALKEMPEHNFKGTRIVTSGIIGNLSGVLDIFEQNDIAVVADNVLQESGIYKYLIEENTGNPVRALSMIYTNAEGTSLLLDADKVRIQFILDDVEKHNADGVIMIMLKFCDSEEFDYPLMKKAFDEGGVMSLEIEVDQQMTSYDQAKTLVQTFVEMM